MKNLIRILVGGLALLSGIAISTAKESSLFEIDSAQAVTCKPDPGDTCVTSCGDVLQDQDEVN